MVVKVGGFGLLDGKLIERLLDGGGTSLADFSTYRAGLSSGSRHKANGCVPRRLSRSCTSKSELWTLGKSVDLESRQHLMSGFLARKPQTVNRYPTFRAPAVLPWGNDWLTAVARMRLRTPAKPTWSTSTCLPSSVSNFSSRLNAI